MSTTERGITLMSRLAAGDHAAASEFESIHRPRLLRFTRGCGIPAQDAEDLVQDVVVAAIHGTSTGGFEGTSSVGTWLTGILRNKISDYWRTHAKNACVLVSGASDEEFLNGLYQDRPNLDEAIDIRKLLDELPQAHRVILLLNVTERYTIEEIAAILKMKAGSVGRKLAEAKRLVRGALLDKTLMLPPEKSSRGFRLTS